MSRTHAAVARCDSRLRVTLSGASLILAALLGFASPASAQPQPPSAATATGPSAPDFAFGSPAGEVLFAIAAGASNAVSWLPQRRTEWAPDAPLELSRGADFASDLTGSYGGFGIALATGYGLEAAYFADAGARTGGVYALHASVVELESALWTRAAVETLKRLTGRCRPFQFTSGSCTTDVRDAFPSGHVAPMGALAASRLYFATQTGGPAGFRWASFGVAEAMATATAVLRVRAGKHSWSDVASGFVLGHAIGALVALAHPMKPVDARDWAGAPEATDSGGFALAWGGAF